MSEPGVSLEVYAHVRAALAEGFALAEILALESLDVASWPPADFGWKTKLARDKAEFDRFQVELTIAEDRLYRDVAPIHEDLPSWVAFLDGYASSPSPFDFVTGLGMGMSDVGRLERRWAKKMKEDSSLERVALELRRKPQLMAKVTVAPAVLKPSRVAKPIARAAPVAAPVAPPPVEQAGPPSVAMVGDVGIDKYAAILAETRLRPNELPAILQRYGVASAAALAIIETGFRERFARDPALERDFRRLVGHHEQRMHGAASTPVSAQPRSSGPMSSPNPPVIRAPIAQPSYAAAAPVTPVAPPKVEVKELPIPAQKTPFASTMPLLDDPRPAEALPFDKDRAPGSIFVKPSKPDEKKWKRFSGTVEAIDQPKGPATPFEKKSSPSTPPPSRKLTLQQHASLCVELARAPDRAAEVLSRYGITQAEKDEIDAGYRAELAASPKLQDAWNEAYKTYFHWLRQKPR